MNLILKDRDPTWREDAACANTDPELFFPDSGGDPHPAKRICGTCPVARPCFESAMDAGEWGVWGGTTDHERRRIHRQRLRAGWQLTDRDNEQIEREERARE